MFALRFVVVAMIGLALQQPPASPAKNALSSVEMKEWSTWTKRRGHDVDYRVVLRNDGTASFVGELPGKPWGEFTAVLDNDKFERLAAFVNAIQASQFSPRYDPEPQWADASNIVVTLRYGDTERSIHEYAESGPVMLWGLQQVVWAMSTHLQWFPTQEGGEKR